jgi:hydrogenase expression/formation protein HypE
LIDDRPEPDDRPDPAEVRVATAGDIEGWSCPMPLRDHERIVLGHGGGGTLSGELVEHLFLPAFGAAASDATPTDAAVLELDTGSGARLAFTTDSYVVQPLFFPGGNIGDLAVNGTVNDLATSGARPIALSSGFILEEGLELDVLHRVAASMGLAAGHAGVQLVTGDTKVVEQGHGDGLYVNTAGIGVVPAGVDLAPSRLRPGDAIVLSGEIGAHGVAVLSVREGLEFGTEIRSDTAPLHELVAAMLAVCPDAHAVRDCTRGGLAASLCELAETVANEGRLVAFVPADRADAVVEAMRTDPAGAGAVRIGTVVDSHPGVVVARTGLGATRIVDRPLGEQLPRIC